MTALSTMSWHSLRHRERWQLPPHCQGPCFKGCYWVQQRHTGSECVFVELNRKEDGVGYSRGSRQHCCHLGLGGSIIFRRFISHNLENRVLSCTHLLHSTSFFVIFPRPDQFRLSEEVATSYFHSLFCPKTLSCGWPLVVCSSPGKCKSTTIQPVTPSALERLSSHCLRLCSSMT